MSTRFEVKMLPIEKIELDKSNPRIAKFIEIYGDKVSAEQISLALGVGDSEVDSSGTSFQSLRASIRTNGGVIHPIIVNRVSDKKFVAIEGNTRVAIYKEFKERKVKGDWDEILSMVYDSMSQEEIDSIRLQAHLVGPRAWDPYSKAKYLDYLSKCEHLTLKQIVDYCGGREKEVAEYIEAYEMMEKYYRPQLESDDQFDPSRFSAFVELQRPRVKQAIIGAGFDYKDFSRWIIDHKIHPLNMVRKLPQVLENSKSKDIFLKHKRGAIQEALKVLELPTADVALRSATLVQLAQEIYDKILKLRYEELKRLKADKDSDEVQILFDAFDQLQDLCKDIKSED